MGNAFSYQEFFQKAAGHPPYPYQVKLATSSTLPLVLDIPTGLGKTAAVTLAWLWRRFVGEQVSGRSPEEVRLQTPRRLVYCLPMRVLVEQTAVNCRHWVDNLTESGILPADRKPAVHVLMGGEIALDWDFWPDREAILIGTQDQLLSRALNRSYSMSRFRWPVHFALLNNDCLWVMDEVQLMGAGLPTSLQMQGFREEMSAYGPTHSLWMSATVIRGSLSTVDSPLTGRDWKDVCTGLSEDTDDPSVKSRLSASKKLQKSRVMLSRENRKGYAEELAAEISDLSKTSSGLTLVIMNQVRRAQEVTQSIERVLRDRGKDVPITLIHSRFRPYERRKIDRVLKELSGGRNLKRIIVATQAIEAGVDVSASILMTELAPWSSLVQRFGRLNRHGELKSGRAHWIDIDWKVEQKGKVSTDPSLVLPYEAEDLELAREQLQKLEDVGPGTLRSLSVPATARPHALLRKKDIIELFDTTPDLAGSDIDVSPFIRELNDMDVSVFWRDWEGDNPPDDSSAPSPEELCPVSLSEIRDYLQENAAWIWDPLESSWRRVERNRLRPGLVVLLHSEQGGYDPDYGWLGKEAKAPVPPVQLAGQSPEEATGDDPLAATKTFITIADHSTETLRQLETLLDSMGFDSLPYNHLITAARWHDRGKAHPVFQNAIIKNNAEQAQGTENDQLWAKAPNPGRYARPYFRHELASALALLLNDKSDLPAYLAAAHHGKVRLSIRSIPNEAIPPQGERFARGIWENDLLPSVELGEGITAPEVALTLAFMELGQSEEHGASWLERSLRLLEQYGPFRLAYLESLLRIADWRASADTGKGDDG